MNVMVLILNMMINCLSLFFDAILKREWQAVQQMEAITFQLAGYANNEAQMNRYMASWVIFLRHETSKFIFSARFQVIPF